MLGLFHLLLWLRILGNLLNNYDENKRNIKPKNNYECSSTFVYGCCNNAFYFAFVKYLTEVFE